MRLPVDVPLGPNVLADRSLQGSGRSARGSVSNGRCAAGKIWGILSHAVPVLKDVTMAGGTLVWIDSREAVIVRWQDDQAQVERVGSDVPAHHRATGHVRHDPSIRHGGGGGSQTAGEPNRLEHLARFVGQVAQRLPADEDLLILGPGTVREHLERSVRDADAHQRRSRVITCAASRRLTDGQLVARLRRFDGVEPRRRTVGERNRERDGG